MKVLDLIFAARPLLHLPVWSIYLISLHHHLELSGHELALVDFVPLLLLSLIVSGAYYINQVFDEESDRLNNKLGFIQRGYLSVNELMVGFIVVSGIALLAAAIYSRTTAMLSALLFLLGFFYSVPPFRLKDRPWFGLFTNSISFGFLVPLAVLSELSTHTSATMPADLCLYFFFSVAAIHVLTTIPDAEGDRGTGKKTIATRYSLFTLKIITFILLSISLLIAIYYGRYSLIAVSAIALFSLSATFISEKPELILLAAKLPILSITIVAAIYYPFYLLFNLALFVLTRIYYARRFGIIYPRLS